VIAAVALEQRAAVFTHDKYFEGIAALTRLHLYFPPSR